MTGGSGTGVTVRRTVVVTRPAGDAAALVAALHARGHDVVAMPVIAIEAAADPAALDAAMAALERYAIVVFVSPNAIRRALAARAGPWPDDVTIGVMGPGSVDALRTLGIASPAHRVVSPRVAAVPAEQRYDSEALFDALDATGGLARGFSGRVLIVRGNGGRAWLAERLRGLGIAVDEVEAYRRVRPAADATARAALVSLAAAGNAATLVVTSSEGVAHLVAIVDEALVRDSGMDTATVRRWLYANPVVAPHARIADRARAAGFTDVTLCAPGDRGIVAAIE